MLPVLVLLAVLSTAWYVLIVRPQRNQQGRHQSLLGQLKPGDHVMTVGGLYGRVESLDGESVVLELAPGMTTRLATAGIARIVAGEQPARPAIAAGAGNTPAPSTQATARQQHDMNQHPQQQQQPYPQQYEMAPAMQQPGVQYAQPQPVMQQQYAAQPMVQQQYAPQMVPQQPVMMGQPQPQHVVGQPVTYRAAEPQAQQRPPMVQVMPSPWATEPSPFAQVAPQPQAPPQQFVMQPLMPPPVEQQYYAQPQQYHAQQQPVMYQQQMPMVQAPAPMHAQQLQVAAPIAPEVEQAVVGRRHSRAPKGMGQATQVEGELAQAFERARSERSELADEYRRVTAPLVELDQQQPAMAQQVAISAPQGAPQLFAQPGQAIQPLAQYPEPAQLPAPVLVPRPGIAPPPPPPPSETADLGAFHRPAPYAPDQALVPQG